MEFLAAIRVQNGVACDVDGLSAISVKFLMTSREARLVCDLRKVDGRKSIDPGPIPAKGNYVVTECVNAQSAMRLLTRAKVPHVGLEPEAQPLRPRTLCNLQNTNRLIV